MYALLKALLALQASWLPKKIAKQNDLFTYSHDNSKTLLTPYTEINTIEERFSESALQFKSDLPRCKIRDVVGV